MTPEQRELFRAALLRVLDANATRFGLASSALAMLVRTYGFTVSADVVEREMDYLADKKLAEPAEKDLSPENRCWRLPAAGRDWLAEHGY